MNKSLIRVVITRLARDFLDSLVQRLKLGLDLSFSLWETVSDQKSNFDFPQKSPENFSVLAD